MDYNLRPLCNYNALSCSTSQGPSWIRQAKELETPKVIYESHAFNSMFDRDQALALSGLELNDCTFEHCGLSLTQKLECRAQVRDCRLRNIRVGGCDVGPAIIENVIIDGLSTRDLLIVWGALFKHVTLRGKCGELKLNHWIHFRDRSPAIQEPFDRYRQEYYSQIDWALDITNAKFREFDCRGVPARLFRRDPESQVVVTRENALQEGWLDDFEIKNELWAFVIESFIASGDEDIVLVAPLNAAKQTREKLLSGLHELRSLGIANPD